MEPVPWPEAFDDPAWCWQVKWDGVRGLAVVRDGAARLWTRRGREVTAAYPDLARAAAEAVAGREAVLDGELVALDGAGRPNLYLLLRRPVSAAPRAYAVFDLLALDGRDLRRLPLRERLAALDGLVRAVPGLHRARSFAGGTALLREVVRTGLEGAVAKRWDAPYVPGRSPWWRKVKPGRTLVAAVAGARLGPGGRIRALALAAYVGDELVYLGDVGLGPWAAARERLEGWIRGAPPAPAPAGAPSEGVEGARRWVRPPCAVRIRYLEFTPGGRLRGAALLPGPVLPAEAARLL